MTAKVLEKKKLLRIKCKKRIRSQCSGSASKPRVSVFRSNKYFYAQAIDDSIGHTIATIDGHTLKFSNTKEDVNKMGAEFARILISKNINSVVFDRNGYLYHGVVAAFADGLRNNGMAL